MAGSRRALGSSCGLIHSFASNLLGSCCLRHGLLRGPLLRSPLRRGLLRGPLARVLLVSSSRLIGRYLIIIMDDTHLFALVGGCGAGIASGATSIAPRGAPAATCQTAAYRDASTAYWWAATAVTTGGAARTAGPGDDLVAWFTQRGVCIIVNITVLTAWFTQRCS
jgi:hypothetical protein